MAQNPQYNFFIRPVAVLEIVDHFQRRKQGQETCFGMLMGEIKEQAVIMKHSICIPHKGDLTLDSEKKNNILQTFQNMYVLHKQMFKNEEPLGWYSIGRPEKAFELSFHKMFTEFIFNRVFSNNSDNEILLSAKTNPIFVYVEPKQIQGFMLNNEKFEPVEVKYETSKYEKIAFGSIFSSEAKEIVETSLKNPDEKIVAHLHDAVQNMDNDQLFRTHLEKLYQNIDNLKQYVDGVLLDTKKADVKIGKHLLQLLKETSLPFVSSDVYQQHTQKTKRDILTIKNLVDSTNENLNLVDLSIKNKMN